VSRYHEKKSNSFLINWVKKNIPLPSKEKAIKLLKKNIKSEKDLDEVYSNINNIVNFLKTKKSNKIICSDFPEGFIKNLTILIALFSVLGGIYSKEISFKKLKEENIIQVDTPKNIKKYLGKVTFEKGVLDKLNKKQSIEKMNEALIEALKERYIESMSELKLKEIDKVKYPLELKFTLDSEGKINLSSSQILSFKDNPTFYIHREYSSEDIERIEENLKDITKEKNEKV